MGSVVTLMFIMILSTFLMVLGVGIYMIMSNRYSSMYYWWIPYSVRLVDKSLDTKYTKDTSEDKKYTKDTEDTKYTKDTEDTKYTTLPNEKDKFENKEDEAEKYMILHSYQDNLIKALEEKEKERTDSIKNL